MAASFTCNPDPELGRRLITSRAAFLELLDTALPVPVSPTARVTRTRPVPDSMAALVEARPQYQRTRGGHL
jgi:hypothetical protein